MCTTPSPSSRSDYRILRHLLGDPGDRPPVKADLQFVHGMLAEDPGTALPAFHYWASGVDPNAEDSEELVARYLTELPQTPHSTHVYRVCRQLAHYSAFTGSAPSRAPQEALEDARITYLLWAALTTPRTPKGVLGHCNEASRVNSARASSYFLFQFAVRRIVIPPSTPPTCSSTPEVQR